FHVTGVQTCALPILRLQKGKAQDKKDLPSGSKARYPASPPTDMPPADFFLNDEERTQIGLPTLSEAPRVITPEIMQEREIVRILLNYGAELATWEGDGDIPVAPLLLSALDDITFEDKASAYI